MERRFIHYAPQIRHPVSYFCYCLQRVVFALLCLFVGRSHLKPTTFIISRWSAAWSWQLHEMILACRCAEYSALLALDIQIFVFCRLNSCSYWTPYYGLAVSVLCMPQAVTSLALCSTSWRHVFRPTASHGLRSNMLAPMHACYASKLSCAAIIQIFSFSDHGSNNESEMGLIIRSPVVWITYWLHVWLSCFAHRQLTSWCQWTALIWPLWPLFRQPFNNWLCLAVTSFAIRSTGWRHVFRSAASHGLRSNMLAPMHTRYAFQSVLCCFCSNPPYFWSQFQQLKWDIFYYPVAKHLDSIFAASLSTIGCFAS